MPITKKYFSLVINQFWIIALYKVGKNNSCHKVTTYTQLIVNILNIYFSISIKNYNI